LSALLVVLALCAAPTDAPLERPQPFSLVPEAADARATERAMRSYFDGEFQEAFWWGGMGLASVGAGTGFLIGGTPTLRAMSVPLLAFGLVEWVLAIGLWARTPGQVRALAAKLKSDPAGFYAAEGARMRRVNQGFVVYRLAELAIFFGGATLAGIGWTYGASGALGVGLGLALEAALFLLLDLFADQRGAEWERALDAFGFSLKLSAAPSRESLSPTR
jgi:hypothetical protein